jgi:hypothetical protein
MIRYELYFEQKVLIFLTPKVSQQYLVSEYKQKIS